MRSVDSMIRWGGVGSRDSQDVRWDNMLIMQTLYRQRRLSSARPGTRSLERHFAPQDLDEHPSRLGPTDIVVSLGVIEELQAHRRKVRIGGRIPAGAWRFDHAPARGGNLFSRPIACEVFLALVDGQEREIHNEGAPRLPDGRPDVFASQEFIGLPAGTVHGRLEGNPAAWVVDGLVLHLECGAVRQAAQAEGPGKVANAPDERLFHRVVADVPGQHVREEREFGPARDADEIGDVGPSRLLLLSRNLIEIHLASRVTHERPPLIEIPGTDRWGPVRTFGRGLRKIVPARPGFGRMEDGNKKRTLCCPPAASSLDASGTLGVRPRLPGHSYGGRS